MVADLVAILVAIGVAAGGLKPPEWWWQGWREGEAG